MTIGERIRDARKTNRITQEKLAELLEVSRVTISSWENGENTPTVDNIIALSEVLRVSTDYLLKGIEVFGSKDPVRVASPKEDEIFLDVFGSLNPSSRDDVVKFLRYKQYEEREKL